MASDPRSNDRLHSWKEIAAYLGRDVRTAQRWEKTEGLPVHRHLHEKQSSVYAVPLELDAWRVARSPGAVGRRSSSGKKILAAVLLAGIAAAGILWRNLRPAAPNRAAAVAIPFTTYPGDERNPSFSPGGDQVTFAWNGRGQDNFDIYVKAIGGADEPLRLTDDPAHEICPVWSPDGRSIAFLRVGAEGKAGVMVMPALGGQPPREIGATIIRRLDDSYGYLAWTPGGGSVVVCHREAAQTACGLRAISIDSGAVRQLTDGGGAWAGDLEPAFSPDGRSLVFVRVRDIGVEDLMRVEVNRELNAIGQPRKLSKMSIAGSAAWLPGGRELIFSAGEYRATRWLWRGEVSSGKVERMASFGEDSANVALATNGARLIYNREILDENIWRLDLATNSSVQAISSTRADYNPNYSPDGGRVVFVSNRSSASEIWICERDGSRPVKLTSFDGKLTANPKWSPDGQSIVFDSRNEGSPRLYVIPANGGQPRRLSDEPGAEPSWSRDGQWIYFQSGRTGHLEIWKIPSGGGAPVQVTTDGGVYGLESVDGKYLYYVKSLYPRPTSLWRMPVAGGPSLKILDGLERNLNFAPAADGLYFAGQETAKSPAFLGFYSFETRGVRKLAMLPKPLSFGLTISPDGRDLLYSQVDRQEADLVLVENFR